LSNLRLSRNPKSKTGKVKKELEKDFQNECLSLLQNTLAPGGYWEKLHRGVYSKSGGADIYGVYNGKAYLLEIKIPDGTGVTSKLQSYKIKKVIKNGGIAMVIESLDQLRELFKE
jgi:hypothetical protein